MVDYLCDMGAFSKSIFAHVYIGFNISGLPGGLSLMPVFEFFKSDTGFPASGKVREKYFFLESQGILLELAAGNPADKC